MTLTSSGDRVGSAVANASGAFTARVVFATITPGTRVITANCGIVLTGQVTQVVTSSVGGNTGGALIILVFFVLVGVALIRFV